MSNPFDDERQGLLSQPPSSPLVDPATVGQRPKNWPRCYRILHHSINTDIPFEKQFLIKRAYIGWYMHVAGLIYNSLVLLGGAIKGITIASFFISLFSLVVGIFGSFFIYWMLYSAARKSSSAYYCVWLIFFACQTALEALYALGIEQMGGAGVILMVTVINSDLVLGIMCLVAALLWAMNVIYNVLLFFEARRRFSGQAEPTQVFKEVSTAAVKTAYDNRESIKQVVVDNKDTIKQVVVDNKDAIKQFAVDNKDVVIDFVKENKEEIKQVAIENKETVARIAVENKDLVWENKDVISSVFEK